MCTTGNNVIIEGMVPYILTVVLINQVDAQIKICVPTGRSICKSKPKVEASIGSCTKVYRNVSIDFKMQFLGNLGPKKQSKTFFTHFIEFLTTIYISFMCHTVNWKMDPKLEILGHFGPKKQPKNGQKPFSPTPSNSLQQSIYLSCVTL